MVCHKIPHSAVLAWKIWLQRVLSWCLNDLEVVLRIREFIPDPGSWFFYLSRIPDLWSKTLNKREGWKKNCRHTIFVAKNSQNWNYFIFEMLKKKIWPSFKRFTELFTQIFVTKLKKIWHWDPKSGSRGQKGTGSRIPDPGSPILDPDPQHCLEVVTTSVLNWKHSSSVH